MSEQSGWKITASQTQRLSRRLRGQRPLPMSAILGSALARVTACNAARVRPVSMSAASVCVPAFIHRSLRFCV